MPGPATLGGGSALDRLGHESVALASGARRIDTDGKIVPKLTGDGSTGWFSELEEIVTDAPEGDDLVLTLRKVAALTILSQEVVDDSDPAVLDATGMVMVRAVALEADRPCSTARAARPPRASTMASRSRSRGRRGLRVHGPCGREGVQRRWQAQRGLRQPGRPR